MKDTDIITVCENCLRASCWHGEFMCQGAQYAGVVKKTVGELRLLDKENPNNWERQLSGDIF